ncbi:uncharacterized protein LOC129584356 [Paramacrobiotus metropolitanus]|uniref:uncharacterized protein LOC129584264 n=1 Tax=Paramacrobiotus metropolitanus TaxID=2943436 RepID=UPI002445D83E|nr:uncharacterized protein LOC129584264 [Paramacrobiotus metropolitanus]XP_055332489.1 uncharacterized protein LOC129584356 [Paramacrobiotus metropolitanus]
MVATILFVLGCISSASLVNAGAAKANKGSQVMTQANKGSQVMTQANNDSQVMTAGFDCDDNIQGGSCVASCWYNDWQTRDNRCGGDRDKFSFNNGFGQCYCCRTHHFTPVAMGQTDQPESNTNASSIRVLDAYNCDSYLTVSEQGSACWFNDWQHRDSRCPNQNDKWSFGTVYGKCYCCRHPSK